MSDATGFIDLPDDLEDSGENSNSVEDVDVPIKAHQKTYKKKKDGTERKQFDPEVAKKKAEHMREINKERLEQSLTKAQLKKKSLEEIKTIEREEKQKVKDEIKRMKEEVKLRGNFERRTAIMDQVVKGRLGLPRPKSRKKTIYEEDQGYYDDEFTDDSEGDYSDEPIREVRSRKKSSKTEKPTRLASKNKPLSDAAIRRLEKEAKLDKQIEQMDKLISGVRPKKELDDKSLNTQKPKAPKVDKIKPIPMKGLFSSSPYKPVDASSKTENGPILSLFGN